MEGRVESREERKKRGGEEKRGFIKKLNSRFHILS